VIGALAAILILAVLGVPSAVALFPRSRLPLLIGAGFLLGCGAAVILLFLLSLAGIRWSFGPVGFVLLGWFAVSAVLARGALRRAGASLRDVARREPRAAVSPLRRTLEWIPVVLIIITVLAHAFYATHQPMVEWDYAADWGLKAKVFFQFRGIDWAFLRHGDYSFMQPDYPLLVPVSIAFVSWVEGTWDDRWSGLLYTGFGLALILILSELLREPIEDRALRRWAVLALTSPALTPWVGLAEGAVLAYGGAALLMLARGVREDPAWLRGGAVLLGLAMWAKNEGSALFLAVVPAMFLTAPPRLKNILRLWPSLAIFLPWLLVRSSYGWKPVYLQGDFVARGKANLIHFGDVAAALLRYWPEKRLFWIAIGVAMLWCIHTIWRRERFLLVALLFAFVIFAAQNFFTPFQVEPHIQYSWHRLMYQIAVPLAFLALTSLSPRILRIRG